MVYSTTRNTLTKSLGASLFTGSPEVSSRTGFASAYNEYIKSKSEKDTAPMNAMEREMADIRAAERQAASGGSYIGSSARQNHLGTVVGMQWTSEVEEAVRELGEGNGSRLVVIVS
jgi:twinfilin-like protein